MYEENLEKFQVYFSDMKPCRFCKRQEIVFIFSDIISFKAHTLKIHNMSLSESIDKLTHS